MTDLLRVAGLCKRYGEITVADDIAFALNKGECLGVIGPNGAGKTTLLNLITGTVEAGAGSIQLDGQEIIKLTSHARVHVGVARAFQVPQPFMHLTAFENALVAAQFGACLHGAEAQDFAATQIQRAGLGAKADTLAGKLPLLDRKRLELAKALSAKPKVLLLDEIAGGLTEAEVYVLIALVLELKSDYATVWIEHIPHALKAVATRLMVLHFGKKLLEGDPHQVMDSDTVREIYMGVTDHATA
jgi:branched-chain amino acid transport system ATP-binding protein